MLCASSPTIQTKVSDPFGSVATVALHLLYVNLLNTGSGKANHIVLNATLYGLQFTQSLERWAKRPKWAEAAAWLEIYCQSFHRKALKVEIWPAEANTIFFVELGEVTF